jgi:hypothetical protein
MSLRSRVFAGVALVALFLRAGAAQSPGARAVQFVFTSDAHYGLARPTFQGHTNVDAHIVNAAMIAKVNGLSSTQLPDDGGVRAGEIVGPIDFLTESGDIANREELTGGPLDGPIQTAAVSWAQFRADYLDGLSLRDAGGRRVPVFIAPGNHDVSDAVGFYRPMSPPVDKTAMVEIYNRMMAPPVPKTTATYTYEKDRVQYSRDIGGVHFVFVTVWPDSIARRWLDEDLKRIAASTPVVLFTHDQPDAEAKHFTNPNGRHDINATDRFENLLAERFAGATIDEESTVEQRQLTAFLEAHPNVTAYFHGNSNWNEFYDWRGPDHTIALHTFRVDSPMKGHFSADDETKLSFQVASIDPGRQTMTVRECLWDTNPSNPSAPAAWGASRTVSIAPSPPVVGTSTSR